MISSDSFDMVVELIEDLFFQGRSIGKLGLIVNYDHWHDVLVKSL